MSSLLHMLPLGSAWFLWDSNNAGQHTLDTLAQDSANTLITGSDGTGKTSLAFQAAVSMAADSKQVTFIRPKVLSHLPLQVHGMPPPEPSALHLVKFWYPDQAEEVLKWCGHLHTQTLLPDVIIVDDFDVFVGQSTSTEHSAARLCAALLDAAAWVRQNNGHCQLILTASHRLASLPAVSRQFHFSLVQLTGVCDEDGKYLLSSVTPNFNISLHYSITRQHIIINSADSRQGPGASMP